MYNSGEYRGVCTLHMYKGYIATGGTEVFVHYRGVHRVSYICTGGTGGMARYYGLNYRAEGYFTLVQGELSGIAG